MSISRMNPDYRERVQMSLVPRYLWRAWSKESDGSNTLKEFSSTAETQGKHLPELTNMVDGTEAREMLINHLARWGRHCGRVPDNLISFASSLLWVLQHAFRKHMRGEKVYITLIDTQRCPKTEFRWAPSLLIYFDLTTKDHKYLVPEWFEAEYLAQGRVVFDRDHASSTIEFDEDLMANLSEIYPEFLNPFYHDRLLTRVTYLRREWSKEEQLVTPVAADATLRITSKFDSNLAQLAFVWFLSLRKRCKTDEVFANKQLGPLSREF